MYALDDTIAAIASPPGGAARGIVRVSGPRACDCVAQLFRPHDRPGAELAEPRRRPSARAGLLRLPGLHSPLPCDAYLWPNGRSYTGQEVVELHALGSPPLLQMALRAICAAGAKPAGPGEFTLRAFLAGRIDLTQAEAVLGVIEANDAHQLDAALGQLAGGLARPMHALRDSLLDVLAHVEAGFDFADEDIAFITRDELDRRLAAAQEHIAAIQRQMAYRGESSEAMQAVLVGRPNAGKSSLLNALAGDRVALISDHPGTTRDYLVAKLKFDGLECQLIDTAGERSKARLENTALCDEICEAADRATAERLNRADVRVLCLDSTRPMDNWERAELGRADSRRIVVLTKCDAPRWGDFSCGALETSSVTGQGIAALHKELRRLAVHVSGNRGDVVASTGVRCADSLRLAGQCLSRARTVVAAGQDELAAAETRGALEELGKIVGTVCTEDVLDRIFSRFCVGK
jgi:tRNA modification GTPase